MKVWLITGCSSGLGREIAKCAVARGDKVAITARRPAQVADLVRGHDNAASFALDVTDASSIQAAVAGALARFGQIDVLVNNAGIGQFGSVEETDLGKARRLFDINLFGLAAVTAAVLPSMRARRRGHIVNVASAGAIIAFPGVGFYNASKWAVLGLSESLAKETASLGIRVTVAAPSGLRVRSADGDAHFEMGAAPLADYDATVGAMQRGLAASFGRQPGDPTRAARVIASAVDSDRAPFRLLLGKAAVDYAKQRARELAADAESWEAISVSVDYADALEERF